jgi:hypothetical protein
MCGVPVLLCDTCCTKKGLIEKEKKKEYDMNKIIDNDNNNNNDDDNNDDDNNNDNNINGNNKNGNDTNFSNGSIKKSKKMNKNMKKQIEKQQKEEKIIENLKLLKCPLCIKENCTIPVEMLYVTANGRKSIVYNGNNDNDNDDWGGESSRDDKHYDNKIIKKMKLDTDKLTGTTYNLIIFI